MRVSLSSMKPSPAQETPPYVSYACMHRAGCALSPLRPPSRPPSIAGCPPACTAPPAPASALCATSARIIPTCSSWHLPCKESSGSRRSGDNTEQVAPLPALPPRSAVRVRPPLVAHAAPHGPLHLPHLHPSLLPVDPAHSSRSSPSCDTRCVSPLLCPCTFLAEEANKSTV